MIKKFDLAVPMGCTCPLSLSYAFALKSPVKLKGTTSSKEVIWVGTHPGWTFWACPRKAAIRVLIVRVLAGDAGLWRNSHGEKREKGRNCITVPIVRERTLHWLATQGQRRESKGQFGAERGLCWSWIDAGVVALICSLFFRRQSADAQGVLILASLACKICFGVSECQREFHLQGLPSIGKREVCLKGKGERGKGTFSSWEALGVNYFWVAKNSWEGSVESPALICLTVWAEGRFEGADTSKLRV